VNFIDTREGSIHFALLWIKRDEMLKDLQNFLDDPVLGRLGETVASKRAANA
jgi:hypothetical protein